MTRYIVTKSIVFVESFLLLKVCIARNRGPLVICFVYVLLDGLSSSVVQADGPSFVALLVQSDCCLVALDVKI